MNWFAVYDAATGRIDQRVWMEDHAEAGGNCQAGQLAVAIASDVKSATHYINTGTGRAKKIETTPCVPSRETLPADGTAELALSRLRPGTTINVAGPVGMQIDSPAGGTERLTFTRPGRYTITAKAPWPARPQEITIHAT